MGAFGRPQMKLCADPAGVGRGLMVVIDLQIPKRSATEPSIFNRVTFWLIEVFLKHFSFEKYWREVRNVFAAMRLARMTNGFSFTVDCHDELYVGAMLFSVRVFVLN